MYMFSGNPALLITDNTLQEYLVDKTTGLPLANGVVTFYKDSASPAVYKNIYQQTGVYGSYTYTALPNPLTLSAVGTVVDGSGKDTKIFYYPYDESDTSATPAAQPYYVTVVSEQGTSQFVRENFPFVPSTSASTQNPTGNNLIVNNGFWRALQIGTAINVSNQTSYVIAPGAHDGITNSDVRFVKNIVGATDSITINKMPSTINFATIANNSENTPEYYLNFSCTGPTTGETTKCIQWPIQLHLQNLNNTQITVTFWAQAVSGVATLQANIFQFAGSDQSGSSQVVPGSATFTGVATTWRKYSATISLPSTTGVPVSATGDDCYYLQIGLPLNNSTSINITKPCVYIGNVVAGNEFQSYEMDHAIFDAPRTGDSRISINTFYPFGWVPANNGTIGSASSNATTRANIDTFQLFSTLWTLFSPYVTSTTNPIAQMFNSAGSPVAYGANAWQDFIANNQLAITTQMGEVIMGTVPIAALLPQYTTTFTASNAGGDLELTLANTVKFYKGIPVVFTTTGTLPTGITANTVYYVGVYDGITGVVVSTSFANAMAGTYIPWTNAGTGTHTVTSSLSGTNVGEYAHEQLIPELAAHDHTGHFVYPPETCAGGGTPVVGQPGGASDFDFTTDITGSNVPFNIVQPSSYRNIFIKL